MGYDEMSEPNMKLSRALLIVLVLHIVAVSGIIAFNAIKTRQGSFVPSVPASSATDAAAAVSAGSTIKSEAPNPSTIKKKTRAVMTVKPPHSPRDRCQRTNIRSIAQKKTSDTGAASESGKVYVVAKGDNPVTIAKKLKVPYDDLIALNHIEDPRKLQIGQKLLIPNKTTKAKKSEE